MPLQQYRSDFPMLAKSMHGKPLVYLDNAATTQKPQSVIDAISDFYTTHYGTVHRAVYELSTFATATYQEVRKQIAAFLNAAKPEEIIYTRGTTESINLIAYSFGKRFLKPGDEIIISAMEHHSNIVPWQIACEDRGAVLRVAPINERGELDLDAFKKLLNKRTKLVSLAHVSNVLGTINPIREIADMVHAAGAYLMVDGAQSAPHMPVDVRALDADFYVFSGHKIYGPTGIGILYGKEALLNELPPYQGGGDMIEHVSFEKTTYNTLPLKFEAGTPMIAEVIGLGAAIRYVESMGRDKIEALEHQLLEQAVQGMQEIPGLKFIGTAPKKSGIISFTLANIHPLDIGTMLDLQGIAIRTGHHCAQPLLESLGLKGTARLSFGLYNTPEEVDRFLQALKHTITLF